MIEATTEMTPSTEVDDAITMRPARATRPADRIAMSRPTAAATATGPSHATRSTFVGCTQATTAATVARAAPTGGDQNRRTPTVINASPTATADAARPAYTCKGRSRTPARPSERPAT